MRKDKVQSGLVSVSFRSLSAEEITAMVADAGLECIEWGGDIHVPHGDVRRAREVRKMTHDAGLAVSAYGSYFRAGSEAEPALSFETVLETALALEAPTVRVWAGERGSDEADAAYRARVQTSLREAAQLAAAAGITISLEYHANTLTDTNVSAQALARDIEHPALRFFWQPVNGADTAYNIAGLNAVLPVLTSLHVFWWDFRDGEIDRRPLEEGHAAWSSYLRCIPGRLDSFSALLEFVRNDSTEQFAKDAATLKRWIAELG